MNNKSAYQQAQLQSRPPLKPVYAAVLLAFAVQAAHANPTGGSVASGSASFAASGTTLTVTNTPGTIINWQGFSIGSNEITHFVQQSASSAVLNRVTGSNPTNILGTLQSNGRVFLVNPNGIVFGAGAVVDVAGLVASTLNLSDADFIAGNHHYTQIPGAQNISNAGNITAQQGGQIYLIAPNVENTGVITAPNGEILLAAGASVDLVNTDNPNLRVNITAPAGDATNVGQLIASSGSLGLFGTVVRNSGTVSADSATLQGGKIVFKASQRVDAGGVISASGVGGGNISVLADMQRGTVNVSGTLDASAPVSGNGGFIETSAANVNIANGVKVTTAAASGLSGTWLIDPFDFTIAASGGNMTGAALSASLALGAVTIASTSGTTGTLGDVNVNDAVNWSANQLTLNAQNNININANLNGSGTASLALQYGQLTSTGGVSNYFLNNGAQVNLPAGLNFSTQLGSLGAVKNFTVITALGAASSVTATDLQGINGNLAGNYVLGSNVDATATSTWNANAGFTPIGNGMAMFAGTFDGLGHTISNLTINLPATNNVGLFGVSTGIIRNLGLFGGSMTGGNYVGALVGSNYGGTISNSYATSNVTGGWNVGGLAGRSIFGGAISNSYATGVVSGYDTVGGLVGAISGSVSNSYATGNVSGTNGNVGGLVGYNNVGTIANSYSTGNVTAGGSYAGGMVGGQLYGTINNSYSTGNVNGIGVVGGLVGGSNAGSINYSYAMGSVNGGATGFAGGLVGNMFQNGSCLCGGIINYSYATGAVSGLTTGGLAAYAYSVNSSYWNITTSGQLTSSGGIGLTTAQFSTASNFTGFNFTSTPGAAGNNWVIVNGDGTLQANGSVLVGNTRPMLASEYSLNISNAHQLQLMEMNLAGNYTLAANIDAAATNGATTPSGMWGSAGFVPIGSLANQFTGSFDGLGHTVSNLSINTPTLNYVGMFGNVVAGSAIKNVGLLGGSVNGSGYVGMLAGHYGGTISNSYATGSVSGNTFVGGLVGRGDGGTISNSYASGNVLGIGVVYAVGGLVGGHWYGTVNNSYATGNVSGTGSYVGGLVGGNWISNVSNSYATGSISGTTNIGGLVGCNCSGTVSNSYSTGLVTGSSYVGGLVGRNNATVTNGFWDTTTSGQAASAGGTGYTTVQMHSIFNFTGWSIANTGGSSAVWRIYEGMTAPLLRSFMTAVTLTPTYNGTAQTLTGTGDYIANIAGLNAANILGSASGLTLNSSAVAGSYTASFTSNNFSSIQQGYDITVANRTITGTGSAANDIAINNALTWGAGNLTINATNIAINAALNGGAGGINLTASGNIDVNALIKTGYYSAGATAGNAGDVSLAAGGNILLSVTGAAIDASIGADGAGTTTGRGGDVSLIAGGGITGATSDILSYVMKFQPGSTGSRAGNITLVANGGSVAIGNLAAWTYQNDSGGVIGNGGNVAVTASGSVTVGAVDTQARGAYNNWGGTTIIGNGGNVSMTSATGGITLNGAVNAGAVNGGFATTVGTSGNISLNGTGIIFQAAGATITGALLMTNSVGGTTLNAANAMTGFNATNSGSGGISLNDTVSLTTTGISDAGGGGVTINDAGGIFTVANLATVSTSNAALNITAADIVLSTSGFLNSGTAATTITASGGGSIGLGAVGNLTLDGVELQNITASTLNLNGTGAVSVNGITAANSNAVGTLVINETGNSTVSFGTSASIFKALTVNAYSGIVIQSNLATNTGNLILNGNSNVGGNYYDGIATQGGVALSSAGNLTIGTNGPLAVADSYIYGAGAIPGSLTLSAVNGINVNSAIIGNGGAIAINGGGIAFNGSVMNGAFNITLNSTGIISQAAGANISTTGLLTTSSVGGTTLNSANTVSSFNATNTTSGGISLTNGSALTLAGINQTGGGALNITNTGSIITSALISSNGNINIFGVGNVADDVTITNGINYTGAAGAGNLEIRANRNITVQTTPIQTTGTQVLNVILNSDRNADNSGAIYVLAGGNITTLGGNITLGGGAGTIGAGVGFAHGDNAAGGFYNGVAVRANLAAAGGNIIINGIADAVTNGLYDPIGVEISGGSIVSTTGAGNITLTGQSMNAGSTTVYPWGVSVGAAPGGGNSGTVSTQNGNILINGTAGSGNNAIGAFVYLASTVQATGTGNVTINGTAGNGVAVPVGDTRGVSVEAGAAVRTNSGILTLNGVNTSTGLGAGAAAYGVRLDGFSGDATVASTTGAINIIGQAVAGVGTGVSVDLPTVATTIGGGTSGDILISGLNGSGITLTGAAINTKGNLTLAAVGGGAITQTGGSIAAAGLRVLGDTTASVVVLNSATNNVANLAANITGAGSSLSLTDSVALAVNNITSVDVAGSVATTTNGVTVNGNITLTTAGALTQNALVTPSIISGALLTTSSVGGTALNNANTVTSFNATNITSGGISFINTAATLTVTGISVTGGGAVTLNNTGELGITGAITGTGIIGLATAGVTLGAAATLTASAAGDAIVLNAGTGNFVNNGAAGVLAVTGGGRWLVYSADPALNTFGGLASGNLALWGKTYANYAPPGVIETGNRYLFGLAPTLTVSAGALSKTYGTTLAAPAATVTGLINAASYGNVFLQDVTTGTASVSSTGFAANAGVAGSPYVITVAAGTLAAPASYFVTYTNGALTVNPAALTVTADAQSKIYGDADSTLSYVATGLVGTDTLAGALSRAAGETVLGGPYAITQGTLANSNYSITYTGNNLTITARPISIAADALSKVYGDADPALTYTVGGTLASWDTNATVLSGSLSRVAGENVATGPYAISQGSLSANSNYALSYTGNNLTITPATLTVAANDANKIMSTTDPLLSYTVSGLKLSDAEAAVLNGGSLSRVLGETVGAYPINQGVLGLSSRNYTMNYVGATFTILAPTVINEIVNVSNQSTTPGTEEKPKQNEEPVVVATAETTSNADAKPLQVCR